MAPLLIQNPNLVGRRSFPMLLAKTPHRVDEQHRNDDNTSHNRTHTWIFPNHQPDPKWSQNGFKQTEHRRFGRGKIPWTYRNQRNRHRQQNGTPSNKRPPLHRIHLWKLSKKSADGSRHQQPQHYRWNHVELTTTPHNGKTQTE